MPNTPVIVLHGVTVYSLGQNIGEEDRETVNELLTSVGVGMEMQEHYMDIMTGLTGGGPSFVSLTIG
jgi:pyrroline-5-carboxylate reductase